MEEQLLPMEGGRLRCRREGERVRLTMECRPEERGLYRGELFGGEGSMDLGLLLPQGGGLRLERSLPRRTLEEQGCWPLLGGRVRLAHSFLREKQAAPLPGWVWRKDLAPLFPRDGLLAEAAAGSAAWYRSEAEGFSLAFPWEAGDPFPLLPLFCFGQQACLSGRWHLLFRFQGEGRPMLPEGVPET